LALGSDRKRGEEEMRGTGKGKKKRRKGKEKEKAADRSRNFLLWGACTIQLEINTTMHSTVTVTILKITQQIS